MSGPPSEARVDARTIRPLPSGAGAGVGTAMVLALAGDLLPRVAWWGPADGDLEAAHVARAVDAGSPVGDVYERQSRAVPVLPEASQGWLGVPGLSGHRLGGTVGAGRDWSSAFTTLGAGAMSVDGDGGVSVAAEDRAAGLSLLTEVRPTPGGGLRMRLRVTNELADPYVVDVLDVVVPVPDRVREALDLTGRWGRERTPQRHDIRDGLWLRDGRKGKPGPDSPTVLVVGTPGFGFGRGEVWGLHVAWSGNARYGLERLSSGLTTLRGGETLLPGEMVLAQGQSYTTPWVHLVASTDGLDSLAAQHHGYLRALPSHPRSPRPVNLNVWEAVYFDHDLGRLTLLADLAAEVGAERYVLDDGWFGGRRDERTGLGDWEVSPEVWPDGLDPLIDHVHRLGLQFGLWFEPEMVNPDSDLYRAHPDWILSTGDRVPLPSRHQQVLDLGRPEVRQYLFDAVSAVLTRYGIDYVKWDHNRFLTEAGSGSREGAPGVHEATLGFYRLLDDLHAAHPAVEWESCSSGGGRVDLEVLARTQRIWTSDMTDALSRQLIQRWTGQLVAPEYLGAHVNAPRSHQSGRVMSLDFRAATAFFGDFGIEWDLSRASEADRAALGRWVAVYRELRSELHTGRVVRVDTDSDAVWIHGVVATDRRSAVMAYVQLDEQVHDPPPFVVPGLVPGTRYRVERVDPSDPERAPEQVGGAWAPDGAVLSGAVLSSIGLLPPAAAAQTVLIVHCQAVD